MKQRLLFIVFFGISGIHVLPGQTPTVPVLTFEPQQYVRQTITFEGSTFVIRAYENIIYVSNPVDTQYQRMNIYIREEYFTGGGISGYTAASAPIFFPNKIGGYMPALPATALPSQSGANPGMGPRQETALLTALSKGYVVASAGARGRTLKDKDGLYTGKAPAVIVDLKAAIRYLKFNDQVMPGDARKIISNGTSAGGALSVLLGSNGNHPDYEPYLKAIGAAPAPDDIFAVSAYCPITNLENADMAYEWQFNDIHEYKRNNFPPSNNTATDAVSMTGEQIRVSDQLKTLFPAYVNNLGLKDGDGNLLTLDAAGNGSFREFVKSYVLAAAQKALDAGTDLSGKSWLNIQNSQVQDLDFEGYIKYMERMKTPPAFDALDMSTPENQLFGNKKTDRQHFTAFSAGHSSTSATSADTRIVAMMNPLNYIGLPNAGTALHWRIRHGSKDRDTGLAIPVILATFLQNRGFDVSLEFPWDKPHSGDYDLDALFAWMEVICR
jgi:hypothetical protein